jgi:hypothetical protein
VADQPFTEEDVQRGARAIAQLVASRGKLPGSWTAEQYATASYALDLARAVIEADRGALAEAGRLLPPAATLHAKGTEYASEHAGHGIEGLVDPYIQNVGGSRQLAGVRVSAWKERDGRGVNRVVSRDLITYVGPWVPVGTEEPHPWVPVGTEETPE